MRLVFCLLTFAALVAAQEESGGAGKPAMIPEAEKIKLAALLPDPAALGGRTANTIRFYLSDLYEYIDGGADAFHGYGLVAMAHQEFRAKDTDVTVDVFDMGDPLRAFGIYAAERSPDYDYIELGAEGYLSDQILNFLQGDYYVKLSAFGDGKTKPATVLEQVARGISGKIGTGRAMPQAVAWLPSSGLVKRSEKYVPQSPMGHEFLAPAATAVYHLDGKDTTLLVSFAPDAAGAAARVASLKAHFSESGKLVSVGGLRVEAWRGTNPLEGEMIFFARGRYAVVVMHPPARPEAFLKDLLSRVND
jgi:hypothetical protein